LRRWRVKVGSIDVKQTESQGLSVQPRYSLPVSLLRARRTAYHFQHTAGENSATSVKQAGIFYRGTGNNQLVRRHHATFPLIERGNGYLAADTNQMDYHNSSSSVKSAANSWKFVIVTGITYRMNNERKVSCDCRLNKLFYALHELSAFCMLFASRGSYKKDTFDLLGRLGS